MPAEKQMTTSPVPVGAVIAGKYRVEKVLGAGAMGIVLAARHLELMELRAIKLMLPAAGQSAENTERFLREARAAARLRSQHVAKVHDVGRLDDGSPYAVIEYLEGTDLKALLDQRGTIPAAEAAMYLAQVCEAIGEAHSAGIVHRDLKPANLFLTRGPSGEPVVKVLDFGIAKMAAPDGAADMTATSAMLGTPLYMSPEQMRGARDVDSRSDIWALGVILYRMLTGQTPFSGSSVTEICAAVVADNPPLPRGLRGDISPEVEGVILRCLQKEPSQRFASAGEFASALARAVSVPVGAPAPQPGTALMGTVVMDPPRAAAPAAQATFHGGTGAPATFGGPSWQGAPPPALATGPVAPQQAAYNALPPVAQPTWGAPTPAPARSKTGLFLGLAAIGALGMAGGIAFFLWPSGASSSVSSPGATSAVTPVQLPSSAAAGPSGQPSSAPGGKPGQQRATPTFGQAPSSGVSASPFAPGGTAATTAAPASGGASPASVAKLQGVLLSCWKDNAGAEKGQAASSASVTVTVASHSVAVSGPAKSTPNYAPCVVSRAGAVAFDPTDTVVSASAGLPAGPH